MSRRTTEDLLHPERTLYRLIKDYSEGRLDSRRSIYRARVEAVDVLGGQLEQNPPNPPGSLRARVYTHGLDATTPTQALTIFYPAQSPGSISPVQPGEHVYVQFEDDNYSSGLWIGKISNYSDLNYGNPDLPQNTPTNAADTFENTNRPTNQSIDLDDRYGGIANQQQNRQRIVGSIDNPQVSGSSSQSSSGSPAASSGDSFSVGIREFVPRFLRRLTDRVLDGVNKARLVIGTDRKDIAGSGYGGSGDTNSSAIDLVAGFVGENPSFRDDKSRLYLSEKANPDEYLDLDKGSAVTSESVAILKSDNDYIVARKKIKIITPTGSILINDDGSIEIETNTKIKLKTGSGVVEINSSGDISLGGETGLPKRIITENDICIGVVPGVGPVASSFLAPGAVIQNQTVKIK